MYTTDLPWGLDELSRHTALLSDEGVPVLPAELADEGWRLDVSYFFDKTPKDFKVHRRCAVYAPAWDGCGFVRIEDAALSDLEIVVQPPGKSLSWIKANYAAVAAAISADLRQIHADVAAIDTVEIRQLAEQAEALMKQAEAERDARMEASQAQFAKLRAEAEAKKKAELQLRLAKARSLAALIADPNSNAVAESRHKVSDYVADGLLSVAAAIAASQRVKARSFGPIHVGMAGKGDPWVRTVIWDGTWRYELERRSSDTEIASAMEMLENGTIGSLKQVGVKLNDTVLRHSNTASAQADKTGVYVVHNRQELFFPYTPLRSSGAERHLERELQKAGLLEDYKTIPQRIYWTPPASADAQAAGRIAYLDQQDKVLAWEGSINKHLETSSRCRWCGRPLENDTSITRGIGSLCWKRLASVFRARAGTDLLHDLPEFAVPPTVCLFEGLIEDAPDDVLQLLCKDNQDYAAACKEAAA